MDESFSSLIDSAESSLLILPQNPSFDQVAAGLSLFLSIRDRKETAIYCPSPMLVEFNRLVGVNKITQEFGDKNLVMRFEDYPSKSIERVSYDIEEGQFKLTIIPKAGASSPKKNQVKLSYSGVAADTVFLISGKNQNDFPALSSKDIRGSKLVHIGIRQLTIDEATSVISFASPVSSVSEMVASLIKENNFTLDNDTATNLLAGIERGSRRYSSSEVTAETFELVAYLMKKGGTRTPSNLQLKKPFLGQMKKESVEEEKHKEPPKSWLEPKIYKGTNIS